MINLVGCLLMDMVFAHVNDRPDFGEEHVVDHMMIRPGGLANMIYPLAKLGVKPRVVATLGNDDFGHRIYQELLPLMEDKIIFTETKTAISIGVVNKSGNRYFVTYGGNLADFTPEIVEQAEELEKAKISFFYGYFLLPNYGFAGTLQSLKMAKQNNQITYFDCNSDTKGWGKRQREEIFKLLPFIDYFMPNDEEVLKLTNTRTIEDAVVVLFEQGANYVVITQGNQGATAFSKTQRFEHKGFPTRVFDTTGAGDSFNAGFLYAQLQGFPLEKSLAFANALASIVVSREIDRYPSLNEIVLYDERFSNMKNPEPTF